MQTPILDGSAFVWNNGRGTASLSDLGLVNFPKDFSIRSHKTHTIMGFVADQRTNLDNEFFDGEGMAFVSSNGTRIHLWC